MMDFEILVYDERVMKDLDIIQFIHSNHKNSNQFQNNHSELHDTHFKNGSRKVIT